MLLYGNLLLLHCTTLQSCGLQLLLELLHQLWVFLLVLLEELLRQGLVKQLLRILLLLLLLPWAECACEHRVLQQLTECGGADCCSNCPAALQGVADAAAPKHPLTNRALAVA